MILAALFPFSEASEASAQTLYKCLDTITGRVTYSYSPCAPALGEEIFPAPPRGQDHPDVLALCTQATRKDIKTDAACGLMMSCRMGDRRSCSIYCDETFQAQFPDVRLGPTAPTCLSLTGHKRGAGWVQAQEPAPVGGQQSDIMSFVFLCVDSRGAAFPNAEQIYCKRGTFDCAAQLHELALATAPPEKLAGAACSEKYGTQLVQRAQPPGQASSALAKGPGIAIGVCAALVVLAAILFLHRRKRRLGAKIQSPTKPSRIPP